MRARREARSPEPAEAGQGEHSEPVKDSTTTAIANDGGWIGCRWIVVIHDGYGHGRG